MMIGPISTRWEIHSAQHAEAGVTHEGLEMTKEALLEFDGVVTEVLPDGKFRIRTGVGDRVIVEMSPYDLERGRISFRHKSDSPSSAPASRRPNFRRR